MLVLAIDTSGRQGSIALARFRFDEEFELLDVVGLAGGTFSSELVPQIATLLSRHSSTKAQLDGFAVVSGPGSFTGLRIGLAAVKALAEVLQKPIAAISMLQAVAVAGRSEGRVLAALDAGRGDAYVGEYEVTQGEARLIEQSLMTQPELQDAMTESRVVTPDQTIALRAQSAGLEVESIERPHSGAIARLGCRKLRAGQSISPEALEANYILRSESRLFGKSFS
jgi:tRNA threonylcarbamoyladenosine biosynthesis protein TsaB